MLGIGIHLIADLYGVNDLLLKDEKKLLRILRRSLDMVGFTIIGQKSHSFIGGGNGVTGILLLSQSHAAFHTYPEFYYIALDIFSCGELDPKVVLQKIIEELNPQRVTSTAVIRGQSLQE